MLLMASDFFNEAQHTAILDANIDKLDELIELSNLENVFVCSALSD